MQKLKYKLCFSTKKSNTSQRIIKYAFLRGIKPQKKLNGDGGKSWRWYISILNYCNKN